MTAGQEDREPEEPASFRLYTAEEVREALDGLRDDEIAKLLRIGKALGGKADMEAEDLFQEAVTRMLSSRTCSADVSMVAYAAGVMRSIASDAYRAKVRLAQNGKGPVPHADNDEPEVASADPSPEEQLIIAEHFRRCSAKLQKLIAGDDQVEMLVEGIAEGMRGKELEELIGVDTKELGTIRKRLVRFRSKIFPSDGTTKKAGHGA